MKANEFLSEMTMLAGSYEKLGNYLHMFNNYNLDQFHVGDIENFTVYKKKNDLENRYAIFDQNNIAGFFTMKNNVLDVVYIVSQYRKQGLFPAIIWFLKKNEKLDQVILGSHYSYDTYQAIKKIYKRFEKVYWLKDGQKVTYNPDTVDQFYSLVGSTGWNLVFENYNKNLGETRFFDPLDLSTWYFNLLD